MQYDTKVQSPIRASIAMIVYNGEKYIREQIDTIINAMGEHDELVISYDKSTDNTLKIIEEYAATDGRIIILHNQKKGILENINNAVEHCRGSYIFTADQDDIWLENKIDKVVKRFKDTDADIVIHNGIFVTENKEQIGTNMFQDYNISKSPVRNFIKPTYWGECMVFNQEVKELAFPVPCKKGIGHDFWMGIISGFAGKKIVLYDEVLLLHRIHGGNQTPLKHRRFSQVLISRANLLREIVIRMVSYY